MYIGSMVATYCLSENGVDMRKQSGFTLIEMVIVVVIIGILAVTAIPKFLDLTEQAEQANIEGMAGGFATAISLARAQWEAEARPRDAANNNFVNYDGTNLSLTSEDAANGVRPGYALGLTTIASINNVNCAEVWTNILQQPPTISTVITDDSDYFVSTEAVANDPVCHYYLKSTLPKDNNGDYVSPGVAENTPAAGNNFTYQPASSSVIVYINN